MIGTDTYRPLGECACRRSVDTCRAQALPGGRSAILIFPDFLSLSYVSLVRICHARPHGLLFLADAATIRRDHPL